MSVQEMSGFRAKSIALSLVFGRARPPVPEMASPEEAASGAEPFDVRELQGRIDAVLEREHASWGVLVYSTGLGRDIAAHRPDTALVPASNVKLFTALASLLVSHVGPTRALRTAAHVVDVPGDGTRKSASGDAGREPRRRRAVCVHPCGDPGFTAEHLAELVGGALEAAGVSADDVDPGRTRLGGDPWRDDGVPDTWEVGDLASDWAAPPSRAVLDRNVESLWKRKGINASTHRRATAPGRPPLARFRDACRDAVRDAQTVTRRAFEEEREEEKEDEKERIEIPCGLAPPAPPRRPFGVGVASPLFDIAAREARFPDGWAIRDSAPVSAIARAALRDSDNLCAEQLVRVCAGGRDSGRWLTSWSAVFCRKHCAGTAGAVSDAESDPELRASPAPARVRFVDGSGLSRHNLAPPRAFVALFLSALEGAAREDAADGPASPTPRAGTDRGSARNPFAAFLDALPATARDGANGANGVRSSESAVETSVERVEGTLGARLGDLRGVVRAKTGSMRGAAALSGYFAPHACSRLGAVAFSVVANNHASAAPDAAHRLRDALDEIVRLIDRAEVVREEGERP